MSDARKFARLGSNEEAVAQQAEAIALALRVSPSAGRSQPDYGRPEQMPSVFGYEG